MNHENGFSTNHTSDQIAGVTTTPLDSIPSVAAPFYLAFDATNTNSKYEVVHVTSKSATHVNHAATSNAHTTAEEVRMIVPAVEVDSLYQHPRGHLVNGKIVPTVASNNLTVAVKTLAGADPSPTDPVYCRIGDTTRMVTAALSVTKNAATNWCNAGSTELATKEVDYFVYLGYNATDGVVVGFSRYPGASSYDDFSATTTNEKYCAISTITTAAATDYYEVVGRFAATLSATAAFLWTVPTYTAKNLIQRPIYETRWSAWTPVLTSGADLSGFDTARYKITNDTTKVLFNAEAKNITTAGTLQVSLPFTVASYNVIPSGHIYNAAAWTNTSMNVSGTFTFVNIFKTVANGAWAGSENGVYIRFNMGYEI